MSEEKLYTIRLWDYFDGWIELIEGKPAPYEEILRRFNVLTKNGTEKAVEDFRGGYYAIFPANTTMIFSSKWMDK